MALRVRHRQLGKTALVLNALAMLYLLAIGVALLVDVLRT